jgi:hypothetical protein
MDWKGSMLWVEGKKKPRKQSVANKSNQVNVK